MNVLVIGSGGREHAIARQFNISPSVNQVFVAPGNDGMRGEVEVVSIDTMDFAGLAQFAKENDITLTFVGPEQPLAEGIVDFFTARGLQIFGPTKMAAQLESSKSYAKDVMSKYNIPTAAHKTFTDAEQAIAYIKEQGAPIVIKADGLAAGKGVVVAMTEQEAIEAVQDMIGNQRFGESSSRVVIEEFLDGEEFSFMSFVHKGQIYPMVIAQDHKRAYDGDRGPNTGGMGAYSPVPQISQEVVDIAYQTIVKPTVKGMEADGASFTGILYAGLILTKKGPKVIEFNARFGDPETQVVLPRMASDFGAFMVALMNEQPFDLQWSEDAMLGVVIAAEGYPGDVEKGKTLPNLAEISKSYAVFHAGTKLVDGQFVGNGGRVLLVGAKAPTLQEAQEKVYAGMTKETWDHFFFRKDIGWRTFKK
ncbi:phosphoribosylamine--glycine ligase [Lysinibacillus sp. fkY74-1]|uniref:Phosphoribosylamine--glycine ligase n=3 Tax=Lysinibacillus TaxID=400634 RepID=B1HTV9_LYSSC|nr:MULTISPECIES: phosphoribosylamine--glycine ligase [Lysinibacillus]MBE5085847.1 phosphoribosylamine--glycine ligase [Bacillus thuringiensis]ACA37850.1 Phosphoribosylamine--glycine ligase [Lysinibacillus sphaericus C3-41]AMO32047.1 phosphoribosylamine--glycine ligase [Lysinibacillus sphaericus]AMR88834.1 phosphoribosylamine--glycine ligase [Lysinibacillus sphaericus]ANA46905.1 phosphoribosylamine--glycine ligase [Lysinibacillus sphaericus]